MSLGHGARIVTEGLVFCIDAANTKSYLGTGTTWTDMIGVETGTLAGGVVYDSANNGSLNFGGTNGYVNFGSFFTYANFTISMWLYPGASQVTYADIFDNNHTGSRNFVCQQVVDTTNSYSFDCINATNASNAPFTLVANTWTYLTCTWNNSVASVYINGVLESSGSAANPIAYSVQNFTLGAWSAGGRNWNGRIASATVHDRVLTAAEITQNFNALRGRYGI